MGSFCCLSEKQRGIRGETVTEEAIRETGTSHPALSPVVDDEVQLLLREPVVRRQHPVDFVEEQLTGYR